jgi:putative lipoic acid-binding regulatory protein
MESDPYASFREKLNQEYTWPAMYMFKFIAPAERKRELEDLFPGESMYCRQSGKGNYVSITVTLRITSADAVIALYRKAASIPGLIAL